MTRACFQSAILILLACAAAQFAIGQTQPRTTNDVKIRQRMSSGNAGGAESTLYIKGQRMRNEVGGMGFTTILQCDLKRTVMLNDKNKSYLITSTDQVNATAAGDGDGGGTSSTSTVQNQPQRGGIVNVTNTITDTGERKEMFGFTARRIKTSMEKKAGPEACDKDQKVETDGWYIDFQYTFECPGQSQKHQPVTVRPQPGCKDEIRTRTIGSAKLGFPLLVTTTVYQPDGRTATMTQEVLELSRETLSAALFDIPEGYTLAKDMQQLYGMGPATVSVAAPGKSNPAPNSAKESAPATNTPATSPKKPGAIRIGLLLPTVQLNAGNPGQAAEALRNTFASHLNGPGIEVVTLSARLPSLALEEARQSQCDYLLSASMAVKKGGGGSSMFGRAIGNIAGSAAGHIPGGGSASTGAARSVAITGVYTTAAIASSIKARDEASLEYKLDQVETAKTSLANKDKAKANADGEDIVAPLVQKAAQAIVSTVRR